MKSCVPQRLLLKPALFHLFKNDLELCISCKVTTFADDTKCSAPVVKFRMDCEELRKDLSKVGELVAKWLFA